MTGQYLQDETGGLLERAAYSPDAGGPAFVLAAGGLRRLSGRGDGFLGYSAGEMFWRDVLGLIHEEDLPHARTLLAAVKGSPGASASAALRFRAADGTWTLMDTAVRNVLEVPGDTGLVVANVGLLHPPGRDGHRDGHRDGRYPDG